ncbi:MAG: peptide chain release factor N(5)-glutamine methyltransferase [Anaerolineales bacterium]|nr:peptide chain release factor N(5)-glutamine methyltransferase [Anaerolineales bacterium]
MTRSEAPEDAGHTPAGPTIGAALHTAQAALAGADAPRLTAEVLLAQVLGLGRAQVLARPAQALSPDQQTAFTQLVARAAQGEPLPYLTGRREFHGLEFLVDPRVLIPRPETELLVDQALAFLAAQPAGADRPVLDVGTGSGCIAVTLAVKHPAASVTAVDVSAEALAVAAANAARHGVLGRVSFFQSDLLSGLPQRPAGFHLLCANLPYIPSETLAGLPVARFEPRLALDGGPDGLRWVRRLLVDAPRVMAPGGRLLLEIEHRQGALALELARQAFPGALAVLQPDYAGLDRLLSLQLP